jgi:hypothetical protein
MQEWSRWPAQSAGTAADAVALRQEAQEAWAAEAARTAAEDLRRADEARLQKKNTRKGALQALLQTCSRGDSQDADAEQRAVAELELEGCVAQRGRR